MFLATMDKVRTIYVVIPVHNRVKETLECLRSLSNQTYRCATKIVVDDGSTDGTSETVQKNFPEVILLKGGGNLWFTGSVNLGLGYVLKRANDEDYVLIVNNDTIVDREFLVNLEESINKHADTLIGAVLLDSQDRQTILDGGIYYHKIRNKFFSFNCRRKISEFDNGYTQAVELLPTRGLAIPVKVIKKIGLLDSKNFPQRASDYDFTLRAKEKHFRLITDYSCRIYSRDEFGFFPFETDKSIAHLFRSFFDIRSNYDLNTLIRFGIKHQKEFKLYIPFFIFRVVVRILVDYVRSLFRK
jgi:GT2 family glycosyltransferase